VRAAPEETRTTVLVGIFVGGASRRMGGHPKGLLPTPAGPAIVERLRSLCTAAGLPAVLVGEATAYTHLGLPVVGDAVPGAGPLGGLVGLLRGTTADQVVILACDLPAVTGELLARLAQSPSAAAALAPQRDGRFEPLFARYHRARVLPLAEAQLATGDRSLQRLLRSAGAEPFPVADDEWPLLVDWDEPADAL
jgi:molybdopterin-guanine dinucleotide biosynthesis protein A